MRFKVLVFALLLPLRMLAQDFSRDSMYHEVSHQVLEQLSIYRTCSSFSNEGKRNEFKSLFDGNSTKIANDIIHLNDYETPITLKDYMRAIQKNYKRLNVDIKILELEPIKFQTGNSGTIDVHIQKTISGENIKNKITIDKENEKIKYEATFNLIITFNINENNLSISNIKFKDIPSKIMVLTPQIKYSIFKKPTYIEDLELLINKKEKVLVEGNFYSIPVTNQKIKISSASNQLHGTYNISKASKSEIYNTIPIIFRKRFKELNIGFDYIINPFDLEENDLDALMTSNNSYSSYASLGFNLNKLFVSKSNLDDIIINGHQQTSRLSSTFNIGFKTSHYERSINLDNRTYSYNDIDSDGGEYVRNIELLNINEQQNINSNEILTQLKLKIKIGDLDKEKIDISFSVGYGFINIVSAEYNSTALATYSGYYNDLFGITITENGVYDFGNYEISGNGNLDVKKDLRSVNYSFQTNYNLNNNFSVHLNFGYNKITEPIFNSTNEYLSQNANELNSLNSVLSYKQSYFNTGLGISYKF